MPSAINAARTRRAALLAGAAMGLLLPLGAWGQSVPQLPGTNPTAGGSAVSSGGADIALSSDSKTLSVNLNNGNRSIAWDSFSVANGNTVSFATADAVSHYTVLNRVTGTQVSTINGAVTSQGNIAVWLANPNGIMVGATGTFSGGSLVLTTSPTLANLTPDANGNVTLDNLPDGVGVTVANGASLSAAGRIIIGAQAIDVTGQLSSTGGDLALVAARSVTVPVDVGSPFRVTINEGTPVGSAHLQVGSGGTVSGQNVYLAGAANIADPAALALNVATGATLTATSSNGVVVIAAGGNSTEAAAGSQAVTVTSGATTGGTTALGLGGAITSGGLVDAVQAGAAGASAGITQSGALTAGNGSVTLQATNGAVTLGGTSATLAAGGAVSITSTNGVISGTGTDTIRSGVATGIDGITLTQSGGGADMLLTGVSLVAGTELTNGSGYRGDVTVSQPSGGAFAVKNIDARSLTLTGTNGTISAGHISLVNDVALTTAGAIQIDTVSSLTGNIALTSTGADISGQANTGSDGLLTTVGRATLSAATPGKTITVTANNGTAQLGVLTAGTPQVGDSYSNSDQINVSAQRIDLNSATAATGDIRLTASVGPVLANALVATLGGVIIVTPGPVGPASSVAAAGLRAATVDAAGAITVSAASDARLGALDTSGDIVATVAKSVTGLATVDTPASGGIDITSVRAVTIGSSSVMPTNVALGSVNAGGAVTVMGAAISAVSIDTPAAVNLTARAALSVNTIGTSTRPSSVTLTTNSAFDVDNAGLSADNNGVLASGFGFANMSGATINVGAINVAQLGTLVAASDAAPHAAYTGAAANTAQIGVDAAAISARSVSTSNGGVRLFASTGDLWLGTSSSAEWTWLRKQSNGFTPAGTVLSLNQVTSGMAATGIADVTPTRGSGEVLHAGSVLIDSSTAVRGTASNASITSVTGDVLVRAVSDVSSVGSTAPTTDFTLGDSTIGSGLTLASPGAMRLGNITSYGDLNLTAAGSITGLAANSAPGVGIAISAAKGVDVAGSGGQSLALAELGNVTAAAPVMLETGATQTYAVGITAGGISTGTINAPGQLAQVTVTNAGLSIGGANVGRLAITVAGSIGEPDVPAFVADANGVLADGFGSADLTALTANDTQSVITVSAGKVAQFGTITGGAIGDRALFAGRPITRQLGVDAQAISIGSYEVFTGGVRLFASTGDLWLGDGTSSSGGWAWLRKQGATGGVILGQVEAGAFNSSATAPDAMLTAGGQTVTIHAGTALVDSITSILGNALTSDTGDVLVRALTVVSARSQPAPIAIGTDYAIDTITGGTTTLTSAGNMRLRQVSAVGDLTANATGSITGLGSPAGGNGLVINAGRGVDVLGSGPASVVALGDVSANLLHLMPPAANVMLETGQPTSATSPDVVRIRANDISAGTITAPSGQVTLAAGQALSVATIDTSPVAGTGGSYGAVIANTAASNGELDNGALTADANGVLATGFGAANLTALAVNGTPSAITIRANVGRTANSMGGVVQLGTVTAGVMGDAALMNGATIGQQFGVDAQAISIGSYNVFSGGARLFASAGDLWLGGGSSSSGGWAWLRKQGTAAPSEISFDSVTSGTLASSATMPDATITAGGQTVVLHAGSALVDSSTWVAGNSLASTTGDVLVRSVNGVHGIDAGRRQVPGPISVDFAIGTITGGTTTLISAGNMRLKQVTATGDLTARAAESITGLGTAGGTGLTISAGRGVDVSGSGPASAVALGDVSANQLHLAPAAANVMLETGQPTSATSPDMVRIRANTISAGTITAPSGQVRLVAGQALSVAAIDTRPVAGTGGGYGAVIANTATGNGEVDNGVLASTDLTAGFHQGDEETLAPGYGDAGLAATGALSVTANTASLATGGVAQLGVISGQSIGVSGNAITIRTPTTASAGTLSANAGSALNLTSTLGALYLESGSAGGAATLIKQGTAGEMRIGTLTAGTTLAASSTTSIRAGTLAALGASDRLTPVAPLVGGFALLLQAKGGDVTGLNAVADPTGQPAGTPADKRLDDNYGRAMLSAGGSIGVSATGLAQLGTVTAGNSVTVNAATIDAATLRGTSNTDFEQEVIANNGGVSLTATGTLRAGSIQASRAATGSSNAVAVTSAGQVQVGRAEALTGNIAVTSTASSVSGLSSLPSMPEIADGRLLPGYGRADLLADGANATITVMAGPATGAAAANIAQLGNITAGAGSVAVPSLDQVTITAGAIDAATLRGTSNTDFPQKVTANNGNVRLTATGTLRAGSIYTAGTASGSGNITAMAGGQVQIGQAEAKGGNISVTSSGSSVSGLSSLPSMPETGDGRLLPGYGRADLRADGANATIRVMAGPATGATASNIAQLGNVIAGAGTTVTPSLDQITVTAGAIDVASASASGSAETVNAINGNARFSAVSDLNFGNVGGPIAAAATLTITNTGTNGTSIGQSAADATNMFTLTDQEVNRLQAPTITIDSGANKLALSTIAFGANGSNKFFDLLSTGAVTLTGAISGAASADRTLQIGGNSSALPADASTPAPGNLATTLTASLGANGTGASLTWSGGTVLLAAQNILFGDGKLQMAVSGNIAQLVSTSNSALYTGSYGSAAYLTAGTLQVVYTNYALFQNGGSNSATTSGAVLGPAAKAGGPSLQLFSTGDHPANDFALFGTINGNPGSSAALQPNTVLQYESANGALVRVTLANSRVNGCTIGSIGAGCLATTPSPPPPKLFDERQIQFLQSEKNPDIDFEPLIGTNNEGLVGDLVTASAPPPRAACPNPNDASCPPPAKVQP